MAQTTVERPIVAAHRATVERTQKFQTELDAYGPNIEQALPAHVSLDKFKRVLVTAVATNPDLLYADRRTLYNSAVKCAADGLLPDGKDAALVVYNTEIKMRNPNTGLDEKFRIDAVQYLPMVAGIKRRMRNTGEVMGIEAEVVYAKDRFRYVLGDNGLIEHEPPPLGEDRGEIVGAYARIVLRGGYVIRDVMDRRRIEVARAQSRQKDGMMWTKFYDEGCKKTVLKHASKDAPQSAEIEMLNRLIDRDDEPTVLDDLSPGYEMRQAEPPPLPPAIEHQPEPPLAFGIIDLEGQAFEFASPEGTILALGTLFAEAAKYGPERLAGARESNQATIDQLGDTPDVRDLLGRYDTLLSKRPAGGAGRPPARESASGPTPAPAPPQQPHSAPAPSAIVEPVGNEPVATSTAPSPGPSATGDASLMIPPPLRGTKPDWRAWSVALFQPKMQRIADSTDFALLLGDNDDNLRLARAALPAADRNALDAAIDAKWQELG